MECIDRSNAVKSPEISEAGFKHPRSEYPGHILEVKLGTTKGEGGTRGKSLTIGGEVAPAYYLFEGPMVHPPIISFDVFDMKISLAKAVRDHVADAMEDTPAWAKRAVEKFGAEMIMLHLVRSIEVPSKMPLCPRNMQER